MKIKALVFIAALVGGVALSAEQELPDALKDASPQQLMGVGFGLMQLTDTEKEAFGKTVRQFSKDVQKAVASEARKNAPNAQRRIRKRVTNLFSDLDERVADIVTAERRPGYLIFKKGLADQMTPDG